jgi:hypothetical protein
LLVTTSCKDMSTSISACMSRLPCSNQIIQPSDLNTNALAVPCSGFAPPPLPPSPPSPPRDRLESAECSGPAIGALSQGKSLPFSVPINPVLLRTQFIHTRKKSEHTCWHPFLCRYTLQFFFYTHILSMKNCEDWVAETINHITLIYFFC